MTKKNHLAGMGLALLALACFATLDTTNKYTTTVFALPVLVVLWFRFAFQAAIVTAAMLPQRGLSLFATRRLPEQLLRGLLLGLTSLFGFWSLKYMPVGEFTAIAMMTPMVVTLMAAVWLGERVSRLRWLLVTGGFAGTLIIARPGGELFDWYLLLALASVVCYALFQIVTSRLVHTEDPITMHNYTGIVGALVASVGLPFVWTTPGGLQEWLALMLIGLMGTVGHFFLIMAHRRAPASVLMPMLYVQIGFGMLGGWLVFAHVPDGWSFVGMALIAVCGAASAWLAVHENRKRQRLDAPDTQILEV